MLHRYVLHNGRIREASERFLSPGQTGLLSGWGVFSTLKVAAGVPFAFERHWARMSRDAAILRMAMPPGPEDVLEGLRRLIEANGAFDAALRLVVVRNRGGLWAGPGDGPESDLLALTADTRKWGPGASLTTAQQGRCSCCRFTGTKTLSWAENLARFEDAQARGFDEVILLNERGEVAECTSANIFAVEGGRAWTPPLDSGCLPGVTRELLLSEVCSPDFPVAEKTLFPADLERADEVFITSTTRSLLPVLRIGDRETPPRRPVSAALADAFAEYVERYVAARRKNG